MPLYIVLTIPVHLKNSLIKETAKYKLYLAEISYAFLFQQYFESLIYKHDKRLTNSDASCGALMLLRAFS